MAADPLHVALQRFATALTANYGAAALNPAQAEDQLKPPIVALLAEAADAVGLGPVLGRTEAFAPGGVRPDVGVSARGLLIGHVELKAPGKGVQPSGFAGHDREQFKRLSDHPNLLYTDGNEWALYRLGERIGPVVRAGGDVTSDGADAFDAGNALALRALLSDFFGWQPIVPSSPRALAELLAPLARLLREQVAAAVQLPGSRLAALADEWRRFFFSDADDAQFADAYAQTVTYALLLARVEGETDLHDHAVAHLEGRHGLLAQVLRWLGEAREEIDSAISLLERVLVAVDPERLARRGSDDLWLYFYEDFLAAYDQRLRRQRGVYFTPAPVVRAQTALVEELIRSRFDEPLGFAGDDVTVLDPAVGTGTYLLRAFDAGLERVRAEFGDGAMPGRATAMAANLHGFELLIGPYAVAHLRLSQKLLAAGGRLPEDGAHVYLTDTLSSPHLAPPGLAHAPMFFRKLAEEDERARRVKAETPILVCIGNPPYFRQTIDPAEEGVERQGGWIRFGDPGEPADGILSDFLRDAPPVHAKNLFNLYVYFWRWALWKVCETGGRRGVVGFVTASSYLRGPGFAGMRRQLREAFDELWILDLGGEGRGARRSENVFAIQTPVAIGIGVRKGARAAEPARVRYARVEGTRQEKYDRLDGIGSFADVTWEDCFAGWTEPLLPERSGDYFSWPALTDLFPWQHSGVQFKRTWPIATDRHTLDRRWDALLSAPPAERAELFRETRDRKVERSYPDLGGASLEPLGSLAAGSPPPAAVPYAYRSLDRQFCLPDARLGDFLRPSLWQAHGPQQLYLTSLLTAELGSGPAATVTHLIPDLHHFRGSFGGKDAIPLWRDAAATEPNVNRSALELLGLEPLGLFCYCAALLSAPSYAERFADELELPGPHIPLTRDRGLAGQAVALGRRIVWLETFGERLPPSGERAGRLPAGEARCTVAIGERPDDYPADHAYDPETQRLRVGAGVFEPVAPAVQSFGVSGLDVVGSWLDYRMRDGAGRRSSQLDRIRPAVWTPAATEELLRLLWVIEGLVELGPELDRTLAEICAAPTYAASELREPEAAEREAP